MTDDRLFEIGFDVLTPGGGDVANKIVEASTAIGSSSRKPSRHSCLSQLLRPCPSPAPRNDYYNKADAKPSALDSPHGVIGHR